MPATSRYFFSALLTLVVSAVFSQEKPAADTVKNKFLPTGIRFGTDVISLIKSSKGTSFNGWEANADVDFYRYYLTVDYGAWARQVALSNGDYKNDGTYFRIGTDVNFLLKDPDHNMFFIGFRYGHSSFSQAVNYSYEDPVFGTISKSIATDGLAGHWGEITTGLRVKIWSGLWMGYTARMKFAPGVSGSSSQLPYDIPGYGLAQNAPYWGFNYQLFWRVPFRKIR